MDLQVYRRRLLQLEARLANRIERETELGRGQLTDTPVDAGDAAAADEAESEDFAEAELDAAVLEQVRDALRRIDNGTYGRCVIDGGPIETRRLDAEPWTPYCIRHQRQMEVASPAKPTL